MGQIRYGKTVSNFSWEEAAARSGYAKIPWFTTVHGKPVALRANVKRHARQMDRLRAAINGARKGKGYGPTGINVLSWVRSERHNREVGGAYDSQHQYGLACDIAKEEIARLCPWKGGAGDFEAIADRVFAQGGFGTYPAGNRHVDSRGYKARWSSWTPSR